MVEELAEVREFDKDLLKLLQKGTPVNEEMSYKEIAERLGCPLKRSEWFLKT